MSSKRPIYSEPRMSLLQWLVDPRLDVSPRIADDLRDGLFASPWTLLIAVLNGLLVNTGSLAGLVRADQMPPDGIPPGHASIILATQAAGPRLALAAVCVVAVRVGSRAALMALGTRGGLLQGFDAAAGAVQGDGVTTIVPALLAMAQCCVLVLLDVPTPRRDWMGGR